VSGVHEQMKHMQKTIDGVFAESNDWQAREEAIEDAIVREGTDAGDPHNITGLLKMFLRSMPEPVITFSLFDPFISVATMAIAEKSKQQGGNADKGTAEEQENCDVVVQKHILQQVVASLPRNNFELLRAIIELLHDIQLNHKHTTKMDASSLARVVGPNLMWSPPDTNEACSSSAKPISHLDCQQSFANIISAITLLVEFFPSPFEPTITAPVIHPNEECLIAMNNQGHPVEQPLEQSRPASPLVLTSAHKQKLKEFHQKHGASLRLTLIDDPDRRIASPSSSSMAPSPVSAVASPSQHQRLLNSGSRLLRQAKQTVKERLTEHLPQLLSSPLSSSFEEFSELDRSKIFYFDAFYYQGSSSSSLKTTHKAREFFKQYALEPKEQIDADAHPMTVAALYERFFTQGGCSEVILTPSAVHTATQHKPRASILLQKMARQVTSVYKPSLQELQQLLVLPADEAVSSTQNNSSRIKAPLIIVGGVLVVGFDPETYRKVFINQQLTQFWQRERSKSVSSTSTTSSD